MKGLIIWFLLYIFVCYAIGPSGMKNLQFLNVKHNFYFIFIGRGDNVCVCVCVRACVCVCVCVCVFTAT